MKQFFLLPYLLFPSFRTLFQAGSSILILFSGLLFHLLHLFIVYLLWCLLCHVLDSPFNLASVPFWCNSSVLNHLHHYFLVQQADLDVSCMLAILALKSAISPKNPGCFYWRTNVWELSLLTAPGRGISVSRHSWQTELGNTYVQILHKRIYITACYR